MRHARWAASHKWLRLGLATMCVALLWLVVLPRVGGVEQVRGMIDHHERRGVDPSAKFYSELPMMPRMLERIRFVGEKVAMEDL